TACVSIIVPSGSSIRISMILPVFTELCTSSILLIPMILMLEYFTDDPATVPPAPGVAVTDSRIGGHVQSSHVSASIVIGFGAMGSGSGSTTGPGIALSGV